MNHQYFEHQLDAYVDRCLDVVEQCRIARHLQECAPCAERLKEKFLEQTDGPDGLLNLIRNDFSAGDCLHPSTIEAYVNGTLTTEEMTMVNRHLDACYECFVMIDEYTRSLHTGQVITLFPKMPIQLPTMLNPVMELDEEPASMRLAADSATETYALNGIQYLQDESGTTQVRVYLDEEDDVHVALIAYDPLFHGQTVTVALPAFNLVSDAAPLTGEPIDFTFGHIPLDLTQPIEIQLHITSGE